MATIFLHKGKILVKSGNLVAASLRCCCEKKCVDTLVASKTVNWDSKHDRMPPANFARYGRTFVTGTHWELVEGPPNDPVTSRATYLSGSIVNHHMVGLPSGFVYPYPYTGYLQLWSLC